MNNNKLGEDYLLLKELGVGGFAKVYKARNLRYGYIRALRILEAHVENEDDPKFQSFLRECKIQLSLGTGCPANIVRISLPECKDGRAYVEMDWVDGIDLRQLLERHKGVVPLNETIRMAHDIGSALAYCHHDVYKFRFDREQDNIDDADDGSALITPEKERELVAKYRVLHNDIHTGNIMRRESDGTYMLLDFGLAVDGENDMMGESRMEHGALEFKSPARLDGKQPEPQDDIYSFGCVLYAMLTGKPPFPIKDKWENIIKGKKIEKESDSENSRVISAHKNIQPSPIERADVPQWLKEMTMRCLAKNPSDRYADGYELYQEILKHTEKSSQDFESSQTIDAAYMAKINSLVAEKYSLSNSLKELQIELDEKNNSCEQLEEMLGEMTSKSEHLSAEKEQLKGENDSLRIDNEKNKKRLVAWAISALLTWTIIVLAAVVYFTGVEALPGKVIVAQCDLDKFHNDIASLNAANDSLQRTIDVIMQSSNASNDQYALLIKEKRSLENQIGSLNAQINKLKAENKDLTTQIRSSHNSKSQQTQQRIVELEKKLQDSQNKLSKSLTALSKTEKDLQGAKNQVEGLTKRISGLENRIIELEKMNAKLEKLNKALMGNM